MHSLFHTLAKGKSKGNKREIKSPLIHFGHGWQAEELARQREELAAAVKGFKEAATKWAPGLGAGSFLADAVGREALQVRV